LAVVRFDNKIFLSVAYGKPEGGRRKGDVGPGAEAGGRRKFQLRNSRKEKN